MKEATAFFRLLGDEARLRILRLLEKERLNVSELTSILGIAQPGVSNLGLKEDGVGYAMDEYNAKLVTADMKKKVDAAKADIVSGKLKVVDYMAGNACK